MFKRCLIRLFLSGLALALTSAVLNNLFPMDLSHMTIDWRNHLPEAILSLFCLSLVNSVVRPVIKLLSFPLTMATFGLSALLINAALFWAVGHFTGGFELGGVAGLLLGPIIMGIASGIFNFIIREH